MSLFYKRQTFEKRLKEGKIKIFIMPKSEKVDRVDIYGIYLQNGKKEVAWVEN